MRRQFHAHRVAFDQLDVQRHVILKECELVAEDVLGEDQLLERLRVHQDDIVTIHVGIGVVLVFRHQTLDGVSRSPALVGLVASLEIAHFDLDEGATLARGDDLLLENRPAATVVLDDLAGPDKVGLLFHACVLMTLE